MIEPNYNFEKELSGHYGIAAIDYRSIANKLLNKYKCINQKEYDIIMWQACNLTGASLIRKGLLKELKEIEMDERLKEIHTLQTKMEL